MKHLIAAMALGMGLTGLSQAGIDAREFTDGTLRQRYRDLSVVLRCPKCQNQNIAESNSPIANDLRGEIYRMLRDGKSDQQIVDFMVMRYGDFVLYTPALSSRTALLWLGPAASLLAGGMAVAIIVARRRRADFSTAGALSKVERRRLARLLQDAPPYIEQNT